jgi:tetratricopeptide (TPR) repeat protein
LGIHPNSPHDYYNLGVLASKEGRHQEALSLYQKSEESGGEFPELFYNLGLTHENLGDTQKAIVAYERFAELGKKSESEEMGNEVRQVRAQIRQLKG